MDASTPAQKSGVMERGPGFLSGLRDLPKHINGSTLSAAIVAAIFGCTGPALVVMSAATNGKLTSAETISWLFGIYVLGGLLGVLLSLYYKIPINGAFSIPAAVMLAEALKNFSLGEAVGAYLVAGIIVFLLGISGLIGKVMRSVPIPIVMAMIAGAMIRFGTGIVTNTQSSWIVGSAALVAFLICLRISRKIPAALVALVVGVIAGWGSIKLGAGAMAFTGPQLFAPSFSVAALFGIAIPLAVLVMGAENAQAYGVLLAEGYKPPINAMTVISGIGGILSSLFGAHNANIAGPMTAICASSEAGEEKSGRYVSSVLNGLFFAAFGLLAPVAVALVKALPSALVNVVAGLAMINVLIGSFHDAFAPKRFRIGAFTALVIGMSNITVLKISAPFWALLVGVLVSYVVETKDFETLKQSPALAKAS